MSQPLTLVALSGGVDSAVAALCLLEQGHRVEALHMTNWDESDDFCTAAQDYQDARIACEQLGIPLHRVSFALDYEERVFRSFLDDLRDGLTPNPDVACNREIKFGVLKEYAARLGAGALATGHYARVRSGAEGPQLLRGVDRDKDQSYFLHRVLRSQLQDVTFPLGSLTKQQVRAKAQSAGLDVAAKRDSTGICFIGERPFADFLSRYLDPSPGPIVTLEGDTVGEHSGLAFYTLGQRQGLRIGGRTDSEGTPWYVAAKDADQNALVVVQGHDHPALLSRALTADSVHWISPPRQAQLTAKTRYRQPDQDCRIVDSASGRLEVEFLRPQRAVTPGQWIVFYEGEICLGGARIRSTLPAAEDAARACYNPAPSPPRSTPEVVNE